MRDSGAVILNMEQVDIIIFLCASIRAFVGWIPIVIGSVAESNFG